MVFSLVMTVALGLIVNATGQQVSITGTTPTPNYNPYNSVANTNATLSGFSFFNFLNAKSPFTFLLKGDIIGFSGNWLAPQTPLFLAAPTNVTSNTVYQLTRCGEQFAPVHLSNSLAQVANHNGLAFLKTCQASSNWQTPIIIQGQQLIPALTEPKGVPVVMVNQTLCSAICTTQFLNVNGTVTLVCNATRTPTYACDPMQLVDWKNGPIGANPFAVGTKENYACNFETIQGGVPNTVEVSGVDLSSSPALICKFHSTVNFSTLTLLLTLAPFMSMLLGIALIILSLGLSLQIGAGVTAVTSTAALGSNPQGTKLAQVMGMGFLMWSFILSQFATAWLIFPLGIGPFMYVIMPIMFFYGLWERTTLQYPT
jgi:hypothetical protein